MLSMASLISSGFMSNVPSECDKPPANWIGHE